MSEQEQEQQQPQMVMRPKFTMITKANPGLEFVRGVFLLQLLALGLKLGGYGVVAAWSWWWVMSPALFMPASFALLAVIALPFAVIKWAIARKGGEVEVEHEVVELEVDDDDDEEAAGTD